MNKRGVKYFIAGNWKMNKTAAEAVEFAHQLISKVGYQTLVDVALFPPFTALGSLAPVLEDTTLSLGAQNMHYEASGAYTGEISGVMLRELFVNYVLVGHSERRQYFGEKGEVLNKKVLAALGSSLHPILCVGETLSERENGDTMEVILGQLEEALRGVDKGIIDRVLIAYEPVWAVGTGRTATPELAQGVHGTMRKWLEERYGVGKARKVSILYGGSVTPENVGELLEEGDIDGVLVGGASLVVKNFVGIVQAAIQLSTTEIPEGVE